MKIMNSLYDDNLIDNVAETIWSNSYDKVEGEREVGGSGSWGRAEKQLSKGDLVNWKLLLRNKMLDYISSKNIKHILLLSILSSSSFP